MNYQQTLDFLYNRLPVFQRTGKAAYKGSLDNTVYLDTALHHPHQQYHTIHVAGTNGKGSVSHILASVLQEAGYCTGLYTSPHLKDFRERIRINGKMIPEKEVTTFVEKIQHVFEEIHPSFFEITAAMAFDYFARKNADIAVIETGLGGRLDSTNIIKPLVSVITNIGHDHCELLGDTPEKIAVEKAGIIKEGVPVIIGEKQVEIASIFIDKAQAAGSELLFADELYRLTCNQYATEGSMIYNVYSGGRCVFEKLATDLAGIYQKKNIASALAAIYMLKGGGIDIPSSAVYTGLNSVKKNTKFMGRWQVLHTKPYTVCDIAHNKEGISAVLRQIHQVSYRRLHIVLGFVNDKDIGAILEILPKEAEYYFCKAAIPRALDENNLAEKAKVYGLTGSTFSSVTEAFQAARRAAAPEDLVYAGGSTFVAAEVV